MRSPLQLTGMLLSRTVVQTLSLKTIHFRMKDTSSFCFCIGMVRARPLLPKLSELPAAEEDLQELLHQYEEAVYSGAPFIFATFRTLWQENNSSYLFEVGAVTPAKAVVVLLNSIPMHTIAQSSFLEDPKLLR